MEIKKHRRKWQLKITPAGIEPECRQMLMTQYRHLKALQDKASSLKGKKEYNNIFRSEIRKLRESFVYDYAHKFFITTVKLGPHKHTAEFSYYPSHSDIDELKNALLAKLSKQRQEKRVFRTVNKEFNGMLYSMVGPAIKGMAYTIDPVTLEKKPKAVNILPTLIGGGCTFTKSGSILNLLNSPEYANRINRAKRPYDKSNYVGVELEVITKIPKDQLNRLFIDAKLAGSVYVKHDGSIRVEGDNQFPNEVTLIAKENNINDVINRVCAVLNSKEAGAFVNNSCGLHVHMDMRNRDPKITYHNMFYSLGILTAMVPPDRVDSEHGKKYCAVNKYAQFTAEGNMSRYQAINTQSYRSHNTLEIRLHSGSTNAMKINHWTNLLLAITKRKDTIDAKHIMTPEEMKTVFGINDELVQYIKMRIEKFKNRSLDTRKDHFEATA